MTDSMVERVARAIHSADDPKGFRQQWEYLPQSNRDYLMSCARAAIEAMREPTNAMILAGGALLIEKGSYEPTAVDGAFEVWQSMNTAALAQPVPK